VLVQQFAMDKAQRDLVAARAEIDALRQQQPEEKHGSFLGNLFGLGKDEEQPQQPPAQQTNVTPSYGNPTGYGSSAPGYAPVTNAPVAPPQGYQQGYPAQYGYPQQQPGYPPQGYPAQPGYGPGYGYGQPPMGGGMFGGGGGFLQGAMQTAAGVVAGEFAFRAIEDMFHGFGSGERGFGGGTEVVNNYFDKDSPAEHDGGFGDRLAQADGYDGGISSDIEDRRGESHGFLGGGNDGDTSNFADDSGSFDGGGGFDSGDDFGGSDDN
jgi:hypothetical protein